MWSSVSTRSRHSSDDSSFARLQDNQFKQSFSDAAEALHQSEVTMQKATREIARSIHGRGYGICLVCHHMMELSDKTQHRGHSWID